MQRLKNSIAFAINEAAKKDAQEKKPKLMKMRQELE
jgi:hypothetical protein